MTEVGDGTLWKEILLIHMELIVGLMHEAHREISGLCYSENQIQQSELSILDLKSVKPD